jgi:glycosyltransferase involved in cell wall biosynthesis
VVLEAMACGTPVLATQASGIIECLKDDVNGKFIKRNPEDISEKISSLLYDPIKRKNMGIAARETAERFSWDKIAGQYLTVIQDVAREKQTGVSTC